MTFHMTLVGSYHAAEDGHNNKVKMYVVCVFRCRQEMKSLSQHEQKILSTCFLYFQIFKFEASNCQTIRSIHIISWEEIKRYLTITTKDKKSDWQGVEIWNPYEKFFAASFFSILLRRYLLGFKNWWQVRGTYEYVLASNAIVYWDTARILIKYFRFFDKIQWISISNIQ